MFFHNVFVVFTLYFVFYLLFSHCVFVVVVSVEETGDRARGAVAVYAQIDGLPTQTDFLQKVFLTFLLVI
jgi:hypothetical protein